MTNIVVILIRVFLGILLGIIGLILFAEGLVMIAHVEFPTWGLALAMLAGMAAGSAFSFGAWRLVSSTLRLPKQTTL